MRLGVAVFSLAALVSTAEAAPAVLARAAADVDGDGVPDTVSIDGAGTLTVDRGRGARATFAVGEAVTATLSAGGPRGQVMIAATVTTRAGTEGIALAWRRGALTVVWRGAVGALGRDAEYRLELQATDRGLMRFQTRREITRCDGVPARLFAEGWDADRQAFRPVRIEVQIASHAPVLTATAAPPGPARSLVFRASAVSTSAGAEDAAGLAAPTAIDDGDPTTSWREDRGGDGRGEFVTFRAAMSGAAAAGLRIVPAVGGRDTSNHVARLGIVTATAAFWVDVPDPMRAGAAAGQAYAVRFPDPLRTGCVTAVIAGVHRGAGTPGGGETAIPELTILAEADLAPGGAETALAATVAAGGAAADSAARTLARRGASGASALVQQLARPDLDRAAEKRLVRALVDNADPSAGPHIAAQLAAPLPAPWSRALEAALARMAPRPAAALIAVLVASDASLEGRRIAARLLAGDARPEAREALLATAGTGPAPLRREIARALAAVDTRTLVTAARSADSDPRRADLWRAAADTARSKSAVEREQVVAAILAELATALGYELRYRLIAGAAALASPAQVALLRPALAGGDDARSAALRSVAAEALARNPTAESEAMLAELLSDRAPGVRLAALRALAERRGSAGAADRGLEGILARDAWPELRRAATGALALRCPRSGPTAALEVAVETDAEVDVRGDALAALVTCRAPGVGPRLLAVARDGKAPPGLRFRAVDLVSALGDASLAPRLLDLFGEWRRASLGDEAALGLAVRAAVVLGRLHDPRVAPALLDAAGDSAFPELQAAAVTGLGEMGAACPASARATLEELARSEERSVALSARRARALCGSQRR